MRILIRQFLGKNHSWAVFGWGIAQSLKQLNHKVDLFSTDGIQNLPESLKENLLGYTEENQLKVYGKYPSEEYDCQISYTSMKNFPHYLSLGSKNRFGVWCYEWAGKNILPTGFAKHYQSCDYLCAPSQFSKQVFIDSGVPEDKIKVISHGIHSNEFQQTSIIELKTKKKYKILANIAQNHLRKNLPSLLAAYGKAFTNKDDVCLIIKGKEKPVVQQFEVSLNTCIKNFYNRFPQHAEIKVISDFIPDMSALYRSIDAVFTMTHCEGFYMPGLEALAAGKLVIAPNWGGQVDFLDSTNSLLIEGKEGRADPRSMYWESKNNAIWFEPSVNDAVAKLQFSYNNFEKMNTEIEKNKLVIHEKYDWKNIAKQFLELSV